MEKENKIQKKKNKTGILLKTILVLIFIASLSGVIAIRFFPDNEVSFFIRSILEPDLSSMQENALLDSVIDNSTGKIIYREKEVNINFTLLVNLTGGYEAVPEGLFFRTEREKFKFGWNRTFAVPLGVSNRSIPFRYIIDSGANIEVRGNEIYTKGRITKENCGDFQCETERNEIIDFADICNLKLDPLNNSIILFNPKCSIQLLRSNKAQIDFTANYDSVKKFISIDPTITITDVSSYASIITNVTKENNFTHLNFSATSTPINSSVVSFYYPFDTNTSGTIVYDYSVNNVDGTLTLGAYWNNSGIIGGAVVFDGTNDYISSGTSFLFNSTRPITISIWTYLNGYTPSAYPTPICLRSTVGSGPFCIFYSTDTGFDGVNFGSTDSTVQRVTATDMSAYVTGAWRHVVLTYNGTGATTAGNYLLYIDGVLNATVADGGINSGTNDINRIGSSSAAGDGFQGKIDEVMVLNTVLNSSQVLSLYRNQSLRFFPRGEQIFQNINVSGDGTEDFVNITINSTMLKGSMINITVGDVSGSDYSYGTEFAFTNNFVSAIPITTPNNISLKFIFYAGDDQFYTGNLINNIKLDSYVVAEITDNEYPLFYNFTDNNGTQAGSGTGVFSVNINLTNGTAGLEFNGANYSATNISNWFNVTISSISAGIYPYYWFAWGNGSSHNYNISATRYYTVNATNTCSYTSGNWDLMCSDNCSFSSNININGNVSISGAGNVTFNNGGIWNFTTKGNYVFINKTSGNSCQLNVYAGGGWNR